MPPTPIPTSLPTLLSQIRSPIFQTLPNPQNLRTGTKYLRRRLRGPSVAAYYPTLPKLASLNSLHPSNKYAGWQGLSVANAHALIGNDVVEAGFVEVERREGAGWLEDEEERVRSQEVIARRKMGRGPPKKGQGKRSQMKKR
ncbi:small subunit ribosomal protein S33, partial [Tremellales sp. Uapishka_1]